MRGKGERKSTCKKVSKTKYKTNKKLHQFLDLYILTNILVLFFYNLFFYYVGNV